MILGISGSPRKRSTYAVLSRALETMSEMGYDVELFSAHNSRIEFCRHCNVCMKGAGCVHSDDVVRLYDLIEEADGIVLATPVHNGGVSAQLKEIMDRMRALLFRNPGALAGKPGMGITVGGDRNGGQELALMQIHAFFIINRMIPVSGGSFGANFGGTFWSRDVEGNAERDAEGLKSLEATVKRFTEWVEKAKKVRESS